MNYSLTGSNTAPSLNTDWLEALAILQRALNVREDARRVWERYEPAIHNTPAAHLVRLVRPSNDEVDADRRLYRSKVMVSRPQEMNLGELPAIERIEVMLYAAAGAWFEMSTGIDSFTGYQREAFHMLCRRVGCTWKNATSIRERWRLVDFETPAHLLPVANFETRIKCHVCYSPVASGAGGYQSTKIGDKEHSEMVLKAPLDWRSLSAQSLVNACVRYRPDVHEECLRYAHRVLVPHTEAVSAAIAKLPTAPTTRPIHNE